MPFIVFLHPDLGIGGAERLVVDAALALKKKGHSVHFITSHHDPSHCFTETRDGTLPVTVVGDWLPRRILGRCYALCAYFRMIVTALYFVFFSNLNPDIVFCDQVSVSIPILKLCSFKVLFYCHFPDQLLSKPGSRLKTFYRAPLNWLEETTTGQADKILVNSKFTCEVFKRTFQRLDLTPRVLYPSLNTEFFDSADPPSINECLHSNFSAGHVLFLSINRYERKKNLLLALEALKELQSKVSSSKWEKIHLIIAGGYDVRVEENVSYHEELLRYAEDLEVTEKVTFLKSPNDTTKLSLLRGCSCLVYTPENEHFGIVPLEAMYTGTPVIATSTGGPKETVVDRVTGFLCEANVSAFADAMHACVRDPGLIEQMGKAGRAWVRDKFSFTAFATDLDIIVKDLIGVS